MSKQTENAIAAIDRIVFGSDKTPVVAALTGGWGEGKTYFWINSVVPRHVEKEPGYISVFGAESLAVIRERVAIASIGLAKNDPGKLRQAGDAAFTALRTVWNTLGERIGLSDSIAVDLLQNFGLKPGWILCIDDVERLSSNVGFENFLGYVSELRDRWKLKVVLIFNRDRLEDNNVFQLYQEKVIDREIPFVPDFDEVVELVFRDSTIRSFDVVAEVRSKAEVLCLRNIRILVKARSYFQELLRELPDLEATDFIRLVLASLLLFTYTKFSVDKPVGLTFEMLKQHNGLTGGFRKSAGLAEEEDASVDPAKDLLDSYTYVMTDELDLFLIDFVRSDVLDVGRLRELYAAHRRDANKAEMAQRLRGVWDEKYHGTFTDNAKALADALEGALRPYLQYVPPSELDFALVVLTALGRADAAARYFSDFKKLRGAVFENLDADSMPMREFDYPPLKDYFDGIAARRNSDTRSIEDVLAEAFKERFIQQRDAERLNQFSVDDLVKYFLSHEQPKLTSKLRMLTKDSGSPELHDKVFAVAEKLGELGPLNKMRLTGMGLLRRKNPRAS